MYDEFYDTVDIGIRYLNEVLDEGLPLHPLQEQRDSVRDWRQVGLGVCGVADMLIKMHLRYDSDEAIEHCKEKVNDIPCGQNHLQLMNWLIELKHLKGEI